MTDVEIKASSPPGAQSADPRHDQGTALVEEAAGTVVESSVVIRHLDVLCLAERDEKVWFPIPGMYGGFAVELKEGKLCVESWSRVVGGSGRAHVVTADRTTLVAEGFV